MLKALEALPEGPLHVQVDRFRNDSKQSPHPVSITPDDCGVSAL